MDKSLPKYIWKHTRAQQIWILLVVAVSMYTYFLSFDLPKLIVNGPIQGQGFPSAEATQTYLRLAFDIPGFGPLTLFSGIEVGRSGALILLCSIFLLLVIINGGFKFYINTFKGRLGERMLRRIRFELVDRILRFPPTQFKRVKPAELSTMVKDEVEPLGGFIGDAFVQPALLGGQALTALIFILLQSLWLGLIAAGIVAVQLILIPKMRRRLLILGRERQLTARQLSGRIGEISEGIAAVHTHDTSNYERADISARLGRIFKIRYDLYQWKFLVKFINNFLAQVTPFLFYLVGGYQVISGNLDVGQLVAVIAAYKDLPTPLKELIDWDQIRQDVTIKYQQVYEQFDIDGMMPSRLQALEEAYVEPLNRPLVAQNLSVADDSGATLIENVSVAIKPGELVAIVGPAGGGGEALVESFIKILRPLSGKITLGTDDIFELPESVTGRRMSYAPSEAYLFQGSIRDNLLYGLKHAPLRPPVYEQSAVATRNWEVEEARKSGNPSLDIRGDWVDYRAAGVAGPEDLPDSILPVLNLLLIADDIVDLGMRSIIDPADHPALARRIVDLRKAFRKRLEAENLGEVVVAFEPSKYNQEATLRQNLLFGAATGPAFADATLASNAYFRSVLEKSELSQEFYNMGLEIASNVVDLFGDLPPDHPFFHNLTFMAPAEIPTYQALLNRLQGRGMEAASEADSARIITLTFTYVEPRHRFGILDEALMARIVQARHMFLDNLPAELAGSFSPYDPETYNDAASLIDNVLLGRIRHQHADAAEHIRVIVRDILDQLGLHDDVINIGLDFNVGVGGRSLTVGQRQKISLARALLKRADYLIMNRALSALDNQAQKTIIQNVIAWARGISHQPSIISVLTTPALSVMFDRVIVFDRGVTVGDGTYAKLVVENDAFKKLLV